jgi:hypothetical protein
MRSLTPFAAVGLLAGCLLVLPPADPARGCAVVPPAGRQVDISAESAVIVWDAATKTEHFTRRAKFASTAADFGFLVPTPSVPELAEADDAAFRTLENRTAPRVVYETRTVRQFGCDGGLLPGAAMKFDAVGAAAPAPNAEVSVLKRQRVGQYDAVSLKADDPTELQKWLEKNGYPARPQLVEWLKKYTDDKWVITAFKIAAADKPTAAGTALPVDATAVRMTFKTDKPFYPYREPADARAAPAGDRFLRVYFLAGERYAGTLGAAGDWPGQAVWANAADPPKGVGATAVSGQAWWLTEFEDRSSPRPGTDEVYFAPAEDQATLERPPIIHTTTQVVYWPGWGGVAALLPLAAIVGLYLFWRLTRRPAG